MQMVNQAILVNPLLPSVPCDSRLKKNFKFSFRRNNQKISYEHRDYESVGEKSLS